METGQMTDADALKISERAMKEVLATRDHLHKTLQEERQKLKIAVDCLEKIDNGADEQGRDYSNLGLRGLAMEALEQIKAR